MCGNCELTCPPSWTELTKRAPAPSYGTAKRPSGSPRFWSNVGFDQDCPVAEFAKIRFSVAEFAKIRRRCLAVAEFAKIREVRGREMGKRILGKGIRVGGRRSEVGGQRSEVRGRRSEVRGRRSEVRGRRSVGSCRNPLIFPLIFHIIFTEEFGVRCDHSKLTHDERRTDSTPPCLCGGQRCLGFACPKFACLSF